MLIEYVLWYIVILREKRFVLLINILHCVTQMVQDLYEFSHSFLGVKVF